MNKEPRCVWWCDKQSSLYLPAHRCDATRELVREGKNLLCRPHRNVFLRTGKVAKKP